MFAFNHQCWHTKPKYILCVLNLIFITATSLKKGVLSQFVIIVALSPFALCNNIVALGNNRPSHFVITLVALCSKLEMDGQMTSKPSNKYHHRQQQQQQLNNNDDNNIPLNGFLTFLKWGRRKVFTSTATFWLQDICRKVQLFLCGQPREKIVSVTARVRSDMILNGI